MTEKDKPPKRKRRWLRFSLRSFLIVLTILCVWIGCYLYRVEQQREAVKWVLENGGTVHYDYEFGGDKFIPDSQPSVPKWLLEMLGVDYFSTVFYTQVVNNSTELSDVTLIANLKNLKYLNLSKMRVTDYTPLAGLTNLEQLAIGDTKVSDVTPLAGLSNLEMLSLDATQVSDVTPLAGLMNLKYLFLLNTQVSDLSPLAGLTNLEEMDLLLTQVSDVTPLAGLTNLKHLNLRNTKVSDEDIEKLKQALPNCKILH